MGNSVYSFPRDIRKSLLWLCQFVIYIIIKVIAVYNFLVSLAPEGYQSFDYIILYMIFSCYGFCYMRYFFNTGSRLKHIYFNYSELGKINIKIEGETFFSFFHGLNIF